MNTLSPHGALSENQSELTTHDILKPLTEALNSAILVYDKDWKISYTCSHAGSFFEIPEGLLQIGSDFRDLMSHMCAQGEFGDSLKTENLEAFYTNLRSGKLSGPADKHMWENRKESGRRLRHNTVVGKDGSLIIYIEDITKNSRSREMADIAFSIGNAGYWSLRFDTDRYHLSETIKNLLTDDEIADIETNGWWNLLHPDDINDTRRAWSRAFKTGEKMDFTYRITSEKSGMRYFRNIGYPEMSSTGKPLGTMCFVIDVTEQTEAAAKSKADKDLAERALLSSNEFLARMSHEIRTPMNGVMGMTDALLNSSRGDFAREELSVIKRSAENLLRVLDSTLEMAKLKAKEPIEPQTPQSPREAIMDAGRLWQKKARENNTDLRVRIHRSLPETLKFDRPRYEQCLNNLLSNAVKFTQDGEISVMSKIVERDGTQHFATIVKDTGIGMTPAQQARIFVPYAQGDETISPRFGGTGLGMSITKSLIERMGGTLQVQSALGQGSTFLISLPLETQLAGASPVDTAPKSSLPQVETADESRAGLSRISVLAADDNATNRLVLKSLFEPIFGAMYFAEDGQQAIDILKNRHIDIVLMDIHMPIMDGIEATLAIRTGGEAFSAVPIIALTADPEFQQKRVCVNIGMNDAQAKPINRERLIDACVSVLNAAGDGPMALSA